jgi:aspartate/methionine/tyrosine aminotransferase
VFPADLQLTSQIDQLVVRDSLISAKETYENYNSFYDFSNMDIQNRINQICQELNSMGINTVKWEGTYYIVLNIENLRNKLPEKYFFTDNGVKIKELDKAFCRAAFLEKKVGLIPLSNHYFGQFAYDNFIRVAINRNDKDLDLLLEVIKSLINKTIINN